MDNREPIFSPNPKGIKPGDKFRDNDVRNDGRVITVDRVLAKRRGAASVWFAEYHTPRRRNRVSFDRLYVDGAQHSQGYSLVKA